MYIDLITKIKNAGAVKKTTVKARYTKMDYAISELLQKFHFISTIEVKGRSYKKVMEIIINVAKPIQGMRWLSVPSRKQYSGYEQIKKVKGGYGLLALSTPKGILSGEEAKKQKVGGQLLFEIW